MERFREFMRANGVSEERIDHIINGVMDSVLNLEGNPRLGFSLGARRGFTTPYRAYITDPYIVIYEVVGDTVEIRRIYHKKEDYIRDILIIEP
jgi:plasmid stabilization system protein ParE